MTAAVTKKNKSKTKTDGKPSTPINEPGNDRRTNFDARDKWARNPSRGGGAAASKPKSASDPPPSTPVETDVAHERRPLGSVWREPRKNTRRSSTNPRTVFVLDDLLNTMEVRAEDGTRTKRQLSPILVRFRPDTDSDTDYEIIDGERRDRAAEALCWHDIEVKLVEMTDDEVEEAQLVANLARADLTPLDEAHAFDRLERKGYSVQQIADRVGKRDTYIRQRLALARLTDEAKAALRDVWISVGAAQELAAVTDPTAQRSIVARALEGRHPGADPMSAKQIRMFVEQALLVLSKAPFVLDDASLVPAAGACTTCPKRSSQHLALIALAGVGEDERCTDRSCFAAKQEAHWTRTSEQARAAGQTVIEGDAARKVLGFGGIARDSGYVDLDAHCAELRDGRTWREVVGDDALPVSLVRGDGGVPHRVAPKADAVRLLRERGLLRAPGQAAAPAAAPANVEAADPAPSADEPEAPEPMLLTVEQIARAAKRARLDSATFAALMEAAIVALEPDTDETRKICGPYDVPVPEDAEGHDVAIAVSRGFTSDGERFALMARAACVISQKARVRLSEYFAPKQDASLDDAKARALHAIRTGARKPAAIREAAGIDEATWAKLAPMLEQSGLVRIDGRGRGREYFAARDLKIVASEEAPDTAIVSGIDANGDPVTETVEVYRAEADNALAESEVEESIRDNVRDILRAEALSRAELVDRLADIEGILHSEADREVETLLREGFLSESGDTIEWADNREPTPFDDADAPAPRVVF